MIIKTQLIEDRLIERKSNQAKGGFRLDSSRAFTLIELLVVVSIIALLVSILLPALSKAREQAKRVVDAAQMHQTAIASACYTEDSDGKYPFGNWFNFPFATYTAADLAAMDIKHVGDSLAPYVDGDTRLFYCPASPLLKDQRYKDYVEDRREFMPSGSGATVNHHIGYLYFGNYVTQSNGMEIHLLSYPDEWAGYEAGTMYPKNNTGPRSMLFADIITDHWVGTSHPYPNAMYTDGSVEGRPEAELEIHYRPAGFWYKW